MSSKSRLAAREAARAEAARRALFCPETTGEPGAFELSCDLPPGHDGDHHAEHEW